MKEKPIWPEGLTGYKRTPEFTENKVPAALLRDHATRDGVWGRLQILEGSLGFVDQVDGSRVSLATGVQGSSPWRNRNGHKFAHTEAPSFDASADENKEGQ